MLSKVNQKAVYAFFVFLLMFQHLAKLQGIYQLQRQLLLRVAQLVRAPLTVSDHIGGGV